MDNKRKYLTIRIPADIKAQIVKLAEGEDRSQSKQTIFLIKKGLEKLKEESRGLES